MDSQVIDKQIIIEGAEMHNLKNIDLSIPKKKLVVVTGLSGSGKSSLAFDTIYEVILILSKVYTIFNLICNGFHHLSSNNNKNCIII